MAAFSSSGRDLQNGGVGQRRDALARCLALEQLALTACGISGGVKEESGDLGLTQSVRLRDEIVKGILNLGMRAIGQFVGEPAMRSLIDEGLDGGD